MFVCFSSNAVELRNDVDNDDDDNDGCVRGQMVKKRLSRFFLLMSRWKKKHVGYFEICSIPPNFNQKRSFLASFEFGHLPQPWFLKYSLLETSEEAQQRISL